MSEIRLLLPFTRSSAASIFPVLPELAIVSILHGEVTMLFQSSRSPRGQSFGTR